MHKHSTEICKHLDMVAARGFGFARVYDDFLALSAHALAAEEEKYLAVVGGYGNQHPVGQREADFFASAFAAWQSGLQEEYRDYLGEIYEERVSLGENGQFFTPEVMCKMMAELTMPNGLPDDARVADHACGSGRTLLSASRVNRLGSFHGVDLDLRCVRMTALNLICRNVNGTVVWGDALTLKAYGGYELQRTMTGGAMQWIGENRAAELIRLGLTEAQEPAIPGRAIQPVQERAVEETEQYSLSL